VGGGARPPEALAAFVDWAGKEQARILIVSWATESPDEAFTNLKKDFAPFGPGAIEAAPPAPLTTATKIRFVDQLKKSTGVFFSGGDQVRIMNVLRDDSLLQALRQRYVAGLVFGGTSAGAAIMSRRMITGEGDFDVIDADKVETRDGLGLLPAEVLVDQHFIRRRRENRLFSLILRGPEKCGIGIDEGTALLVKDGRWAQVVGTSQVMLVRRDSVSSLVIHLLKPTSNIDLKKYRPVRN